MEITFLSEIFSRSIVKGDVFSYFWPQHSENWRIMTKLTIFNHFEILRVVWSMKNSILHILSFITKTNILRTNYNKNEPS